MNKKLEMNNLFFKSIILILVLISQINYSQNNFSEIIYKKRGVLVQDSTKRSETYFSAQKILAQSFQEMNNIEYSLIFNNSESYFKKNESMDSDDKSSNLAKKLSNLFGASPGVYYSNLKNKKKIHQKNLASDLFLIESSTNNIPWVLSEETKKIGNYICNKATCIIFRETIRGLTQLNVSAWYTPLIPVSFGPAGYDGLPGLILELELGNIIFYAYKIDLSKREDIVINMPKKGIKVSEKEYSEIEKKGFEQYRHN